MLPGAILGGNTALAFYRLADCGKEPLAVLSQTALLWTSVGCIAAWCWMGLRRITSAYYCVSVIMSIAFACSGGLCWLAGWGGWLEGVAGCCISAIFTAFFLLCFDSHYITKRERWSFVVGGLLAGYFLFHIGYFRKLGWGETLFFYLNTALLICWCFASPLTVRGKVWRRIVWRLVMLAAAFGVFFLCPIFQYGAWGRAPESFPDGVWQFTHITRQGSRFVRIDPHDRSGIFTPDGRLIAWYEPDEDMLHAIPGILGLVKERNAEIKLICNYNSCLYDVLHNKMLMNVDCCYVPSSLTGCIPEKITGKARLHKGSSGKKEYDLLIISALDDNQYSGYVKRQWQKLLPELKQSALVAVRGNLLSNATLFRLLNDSFSYSGVLPGPCRIWVFSNEKLDFSTQAIDANFSRLTGALPGTYTSIVAQDDLIADLPPPPAAEDLRLGNNRWLGNWLWLLAAAALALVWRAIRLTGERRGIMYNFWNSMENGFAGLATVLLALGILQINCGIFALTAAVLSLLVILKAGHFRAGGVWASLIGLLILLIAAQGPINWHWLLIVVMIQTMFFTGVAMRSDKFSLPDRRNLTAGSMVGFVFAAAAMLAVWLLNVPLLVIWTLIFAARLPGIWQNKYMRV